jgi:predicted metal-dependent hydrolase
MNFFVAKIVNICDKNKKHYLKLRRQKTIITEENYNKASKRLIEIFNDIP